MPAVKMKVELLASASGCDELEKLVEAYRVCYRTPAPRNVGDAEALVQRGLAAGHLSPLEHVSLTFKVYGISRACSHQLVRHRIASYSQQSQRYVDATGLQYVIPPEIEKNETSRRLFMSSMVDAEWVYTTMVKDGVKKEDARFVLPNAAATEIVMTMNCRELLHFFEERLCTRAQWEIRAMAEEMRKICETYMPTIFYASGPKCRRLGYCPEYKSCGKSIEKRALDALVKRYEKPTPDGEE